MSAQRFALVSPSFSVQEIGRDQFCAKSYIFDIDLWEMQFFFILKFAGGVLVCDKKKREMQFSLLKVWKYRKKVVTLQRF